MGGQSSSTQTQNQSSTTAPWAQAQPALQGILGQLQGQLGTTGITGAENNAIDRYALSASAGNPHASQIASFTNDLLSGGGAMNQAGAVSQNLADYQRRLNPTADGANIGQNSGLLPYLDTIRNDVTNQVNGSFAAAGRDFSGMNQQALGRGIAQGQAPVIASQYNTDVANQRGAADALYGAGNNTSGLLTGLRQQGLSNQQAGASLAQSTHDSNLNNSRAQLEAEAMRRGIPVQALGLLANIGIPIAGLGSQSTGQSTSRGTNQMSGAQQFQTIASGIGSLMPRFPISFGG